jgi:hypothetical protein
MIEISDTAIKVITIGLMLAHIGVLVWSGWFRRSFLSVVALNLIVSGGVVLYWGLNIPDLMGAIEMVWAFVAFEFVVLVTSLLAIFRLPVPRAAIWTEFAANALLIGLAFLFTLTFHLTRLI